MVHVRVRQQQNIDRGKVLKPQGRGYITFWSYGAETEREADFVPQGWIRQDVDSVEINEHRCMAQPGHRDLVVGPLAGFGFDWGGEDSAMSVGNESPGPTGSALFGRRQPPGGSAQSGAGPRRHVFEKSSATSVH